MASDVLVPRLRDPAHVGRARARIRASAPRLALAVAWLACASSAAGGATRATRETAGEHPGGSALERIDDSVARGELDYSAAARQKLYYLFDRARMDPAWNAQHDPPSRCATVVLAGIAQNFDRVDAATRDLYARLTRTSADLIANSAGSYQTAHFRIDYQTSGPDAPPAEDVNPADGVPDLVERTGEACEHSWSIEVDALGYRSPEVPNGAQGRYTIEYQAQNSYGYTTVISGQRTKIVLRPNFDGLPINDDPDGSAMGALRATVAHELKHAIQRMYTNWTEGSYLELDATWVEDIVYDDVNDFYHFLEGNGSPFTAPYASLVSVGAASYEDCNWEHYQTERFGNVLMRTFWERRAVIVEPVMNTYAANLLNYGTTLDQVWPEYVAWNFASGRHASAGFGYQEAAAYPTTPATFTFTSLPVSGVVGSMPGLAANTALVENLDGALAGTPEFSFTGSENPALTFGVSVLLCDRAGAVTRVPMPVVGGVGTLLLSSHDWADIAWAALVIGNTVDFPLYVPYSFSVRAVAPILITHARVGDVAGSASPVMIRALVQAGTAALDPASVALAYRIDGGTPVTLAMSPTGTPDEFAATIPPQLVGSIIEYHVTAHSTAGDLARAPAGPGDWYACEVASVVETFENPGNWTVGDAGDNATTGAWERAQPIGSIAAPYQDATLPPGVLCYVTAAVAADVDSGKTTLLSPVYAFDPVGYVRCVARYQRWYSNQIGGRFDDTWRVDASNDGGASWTSVETVTRGENDWKQIEVDLLALFGPPSRVRFRFVAEDSGTPSLVEAGVDDFEIVAVLANPLAVDPSPIAGPRIGLAAPNPSAAGVRLPLLLSAPSSVAATVRDPMGRTVRELVPGRLRLPAGPTTIQWDGRTSRGDPARTGVYWIDVAVGERHLERRVVILH